ncbi:MAG: hypothetical protein KIT31_08640 [Deltaproteobacteria bacterium]|nr:hypothetical protein [Deltaproteobacteria bacterium]
MRRRPLLVAGLLTLLVTSPALAGPDGGGRGGGGGRLGQVVGGLSGAKGGGSGGGRSGGGGASASGNSNTCRVGARVRPVYLLGGAGIGLRGAPAPDTTQSAKLELYAAAQRVHESDGAYHAELGVRDGRFRLTAAITHFYEPRPDNRGEVTLTMPSLVAGVRIDDGGPTSVWLLGGVVAAMTKVDGVTQFDPAMTSSHTGGLGGARLEHQLTRKTSALGEVQRLYFPDDVRATVFRTGLRFGFVQASFRVVDFNVGPALYGPEIGLRF